MKTKKWAIGLMIMCTLFTSIAQFFLKKGAGNLILKEGTTTLINSILYNPQLIIGCFLYGFAAIIFILALRGGEVSVLYPIIATSYIWVTIISMYFLAEQVNNYKWAGVTTIFLGIVLIGIGSKRLGRQEND